MNSTRKTCYLAALAAVGGISIASGVHAFTAPSAGQMALWVNTATGDVTLVGNGTVFEAYGATSSGNNIVSANFLKPMNSMDSWNVLSSTGGYIAEGKTASQSTVTINSTGSQTAGATTGPVNLGNIFNTTLDAQDLSFHWLNGSGAYELGTIQYGSLGVATQTWAPGGVDGSGNWDTSTNNWNPGPTTWSNNNAAVFGLGGSTSETVTIDTTGITASGLTFNAMSSGAYYTIAGTSTDNLTLSNGGSGGTVDIVLNANATLSTPWTTDSNLLITGNKTLTFTGDVTFSPSSGLNVTIGDAGASGVPTVVVNTSGGGTGHPNLILNGGTFINSGGFNHGGISEGGTGIINTVDYNGNTTADEQIGITQNVAGTTLVLRDGTISLTGNNSSTFTAGTLQFGNGAAATNILFGYQVSSANNNNLPASGVTIAMDDATLTQASAAGPNGEAVDIAANTISNAMTLNGANTINTGTLYNLTIAGNITDGKSPGSLTVNGDGISTLNVILTGTDTYSGGTTIPTGQTLEIGSSGTTGSITGNVADNGGVLAFSRSDSITFGGVISGANGVLEQDGNGTLTLTGANTYTGNTVNNGMGTLAIGAGGSIADSAQVVLQGTGSVFDISAGGNQTIKKLLGNSGTSVNLGGNTLTEGAGGSSTFAGGITGTGGLTVAGTSTVFTLTAANLYSGATTISAGDTLALKTSGSIYNSSVAVAGGATFDISQISGSSSTIIQGLSGAGTVALGGKGLAEDGAGTFSGVIQDGGIGGGSGGYLNKNGTGTLTLSGVNTYTGATTINSGTLALSGSGSIADSSGFNGGLGTFDISQIAGSTTIKGLGNFGGTVALGAKNLTVDLAGGDLYGGTITDGGIGGGTGGSIVKNGSGTLTLSGNNTYTGGTTVNAGTLVAGSNTALGTGAVSVNNTSTLETSGAQAGSGTTVNLNAGSYTQSAGGTLALLANSSTNYDSIDLGNGAATLAGTLNLIFASGSNPLGGQMYKVVQTTATELSSDNFSNIVLTNGGTLHATASFVNGTGEVITLLSVPTLYWTGSTTGTALADANGNWDTTGGNTVWSSAASAGTASVWSNATGGDIASFGAGTATAVTVTIDQTGVMSSGIIFNAMPTGGSYTIASGGAGDNLNLTGVTTITMNANATISAPIVGTGALTIGGTNTLTLSSLGNTYTGGTIINTGATLDVTGVITGAVADNGTFDVNDGFGITDLTGSGAMALATSVGLSINPTAADVFSGTLTGDSSTLFAVAGADSLTLTGNLSGYAGTFKALGGVLTLNASGTLNSSATLEVANNGTLNVAYSNLFGNVAAFSGNTTNGFLNFIGTGANGTLGNGALLISIADTTGTTTNTIDGGGSANTLTIASPIQSANTGSGGSNTLVLQNGTFILASTNNVSDFIDNGTLQVGNGSNFSTVQFSAVTNLPAGTVGLVLNRGELSYTGTGAANIVNAITDSGVTVDIIDANAQVLTLNGAITNPGSQLILQNGTLVLGSGSNSADFTDGVLQVGNGTAASTVQFGAASDLPGNPALIYLKTGELAYTGSISATVANNFTIIGGTDGTIDAGGQNLTLSGNFSTGGLGTTLTLQDGTLQLTSTGNSSFFTAGTLQIGNGTLASTVQFAAGTNLPGSGATIALDAGTLTFTGTTNDGNSSTVTLTGANTINTGTGGDLTLFGNITDGSSSGSLTVNGDGTSNKILYCAGAVSYTGTTTITGGTLEFGGDTSGLAGNITDNAALAFLQTADSSISGIISGTGSVTQQGSATLTLSGANTYAGATTITSGTLELTGNTSGLTGGIVNNSALVFAQASNSNFGQVISGTGSVTQQGTATLTLSAANTYSGNTTVASGASLNITGSLYQGSGHGNILDNGTMDVANGVTVGSLTGTGILDLTNTGSPLIVTLSSIFGGAVTGDGELEASGTGITLTLNGSLAGFTGNLLAANGGNILVGTGAGQLSGSVNLDITNNLSISLSYGTLAGAGNAVNFTGNTTTAGELFVTGTGTGTLGAIDITDTTGTTTNTIDGNGVANTLNLNGAITSAGTGSNTLILQNGTFILAGTNDSSFVSGALQIGNGSLTTNVIFGFNSSNNLPGNGATIALNTASLTQASANGSNGETVDGSANTINNAITLTGVNTINTGTLFNLTLAGNITDGTSAGSLIVNGDGISNKTLIITGTNTYSGGTTIESGSTVNFTNASAFGTGTVTIGTGGGTLQYGLASLTLGNNLALIGNGTIDTNGLGDPSSGVTLAGNITGSANLTINSSVAGGELYLTGSNGSLTGNTTLENGVEVGIGTGTAFGSGTITIGTGGGTVEYDAAVSVNNSLVLSNAGAGINMHSEAGTWAGVISGTNSLLIHDTLGGGALTLTNVNTYSGSTTIGLGNAVTLALSGSGSIADSSGVSIASGGTFDISATTSGASIVSLGGVSGSSVALGSQTLTITNAATGANGTFAGIIAGAGGGLTLSAGTEILSGDNTYTGGTTINAGTLVAGSSNAFGSGAVVLNNGSALETSYAAAGTLSGSALTINAASFTQNANTTIALGVTSSSTTLGSSVNDSIHVTGNASLNGTLDLILGTASTPAKSDVYEVVTAGGTVTGTNSVVLSYATGFVNPPTNLHGFATIDPGIGEIVTLETQYFVNLGSFTPNEASLANYLNINAIGPNTPTALATLLNTIASESPGQQAAFLDSLTPQAYGGLADEAFQGSTFLSEEVFNQLEQVFENGGFNTSGLTMLKTTDQDPFAVSMDAAMASAKQQAQNSAAYLDALGMPGVGPEVPAQESPYSGFSGFVLGTITVDQLPENSGFPEQHFTTGSVLAGLDYRLNPNLVVGAMFNWGYTGGTMDSYGSRWRSSSYTPGIFASWQKAGFYANALMSYTYNTYKINRNVSSTVATGAPDANQYDADVLAGYYFPVAPGLKIGPAAGVGFTQMNVGGFNETGSPFDLSVSKQHADSLRSLLGAQGQYAFHISRMPLPISINFNAFWQHEFLDSSRNITASFTQLGGSFLYTTPGPSRDAALLGLGASGYLTRNVSLFVNYETQIGNKSQFAQTVMAGVAVNF